METFDIWMCWTAWAVRGLIETTLVAMVVAMVWLACFRWMSPAVGCWLFLLVVLKAVIPVSLPLPTAIARWLPTGVVRWDVQESEHMNTHSGQVPESTPSTQPMEPATSESVPSPAPMVSEPAKVVASPDVASAAGTPPRLFPFRMVLVLGWCVGVLVLLGRSLHSEWRFRQLIRRAVLVDEAVSAWVSDDAVQVRKSPEIAVPAVCGLLQPTILLPTRLVETLPAEELRWILFHEMAHLRRYDLWMAIVLKLATIVQFFNPVIWLAAAQIHRLREYACDDLALASMRESTKGMKENTATGVTGSVGYSGGLALLHIVEHARIAQMPVGEILGAFDAKTSIRRRLLRLIDDRRKLRTRFGIGSLVVLAMVAILTLPKLTARQAVETSPKEHENDVVTEAEMTLDMMEENIPTIPISGRVLMPDGTQAANLMVCSELYHDKDGIGRRGHADMMDSPMDYTREVQVGGVFLVTAGLQRKPGDSRDGFAAPILVTRITDPPVPEQFDIRLCKGIPVHGRIMYENGTPVVGKRVRITAYPLGRGLVSLENLEPVKGESSNGKRPIDILKIAFDAPSTDERGEYTTWLVPGEYDLSILELCGRDTQKLVIREDGDAPLETSFTLPNPTSMRVTMPDGSPATDVTVRFFTHRAIRDESNTFSHTNSYVNSIVPKMDDDGMMSEVLLDYTRIYIITTDGRFGIVKEIHGEERELPHEWTLEPTASVRAQLLDQSGASMVNEKILCEFPSIRPAPHGGSFQMNECQMSGTTDGAGGVSFDRLCVGGEYCLTWNHEGRHNHTLAKFMVTQPGEVIDLGEKRMTLPDDPASEPPTS